MKNNKGSYNFIKHHGEIFSIGDKCMVFPLDYVKNNFYIDDEWIFETEENTVIWGGCWPAIRKKTYSYLENKCLKIMYINHQNKKIMLANNFTLVLAVPCFILTRSKPYKRIIRGLIDEKI